ncbi:molybdopterin-dependent oxidoreductase [Actinocorallia sp. API 0066]|nr:molybdopterin-dependent oxidoreductase [Actinocorallia sp. API 0066]
MRVHPGAPLEPVSWDAALDAVAGKVRGLRASYGHDAVAVLGGCAMTGETAYRLGRFARSVLRTPRVAFSGGPRVAPGAAEALARAFGVDRPLPGPLADFGDADVLLLVGDAAEASPSFPRELRRMRAAGGILVVADPRRSETARMADLHLQLTPGTDLALAHGMLRLADADGLVDAGYVAARTTGFARLRTALSGYWPERAERITGVPVALMREAVRLLSSAGRAYVVAERPRDRDTVAAFVNLALALGLPGHDGSGFACATDPGEGHGQRADLLPGDRPLDDAAARAAVAAVWGMDPTLLPASTVAAERLLYGPRKPRALLLFGSDPVASSPRPAAVEERLNGLDLLVVADHTLSETARRADVVLPTAHWNEVSGTVTTLEGRVLRRERVMAPPEGVRTELEVLRDLASRLDGPGEWSADPEEVLAELGRASSGGSADYAGITYARIDVEGGVFRPCPDPAHPGTPRPFLDGFATPDGRARFTAVDQPGAAEEVDARYPLYLTAERQPGGTHAPFEDTPYLELHPELAERLGIGPGATVRVSGRRGVVIARARLSDTLREDTVCLPFPWGGAGPAHPLAGDGQEPAPAVWAVRVEPTGLPDPLLPLMLDGP